MSIVDFKLIGVGTFSQVYKVKGEDRVVKLARQVLMNEVIWYEHSMFHALQHRESSPYIAQCRGICKIQRQDLFLGLKLEYYPSTLDRMISIKEIIDFRALASNVLDALLFLKKHEIVHADIKPANILVSSCNRFILTDFGSAFFEGEMYEPDQYLQTLYYRAPESVLRRDEIGSAGIRITRQIDVWSLAIVFLEAYIGKTCFPFAFQADVNRLREAQHKALLESKETLLQWLRSIKQFSVTAIESTLEDGLKQGGSLDSAIDYAMRDAVATTQNLALLYFHEEILKRSYEELQDSFSQKALDFYNQKNQVRSWERDYASPPSCDELFRQAMLRRREGDVSCAPLMHFIDQMLNVVPWKRASVEQLRMHPFIVREHVYEEALEHFEKNRKFLYKGRFVTYDEMAFAPVETRGDIDVIVVEEKLYRVKKGGEHIDALINEDYMLRLFAGEPSIIQREGCYYAMQDKRLVYEAGYVQDLYTYCREKPLSWIHLQSVVQDVQSALEAMDRANVIHAQVTPKSLWMYGEKCKLSDFDIAFIQGHPAPNGNALCPDPNLALSGITKATDIWDAAVTLLYAYVAKEQFMQALRDQDSPSVLHHMACMSRVEDDPVHPLFRHLLICMLMENPSERITPQHMKEHAFLNEGIS